MLLMMMLMMMLMNIDDEGVPYGKGQLANSREQE